jgi:hypothetical protein
MEDSNMSERVEIGFNHHFPGRKGGSYSRDGNSLELIKIYLEDGSTISPPKYPRSEFEILIPLVREMWGESKNFESIAKKYEEEVREIIASANQDADVRIDKYSDCGPGAPWPVMSVILLVPPAVYYSMKILDRIKEWATKHEKEPVFSEECLRVEAARRLESYAPNAIAVPYGSWVHRKTPASSLEQAVTYSFVFRDTVSDQTWYIINMSSSSEFLDVRTLKASPDDIDSMVQSVIQDMKFIHSEYLETQCLDRAVPSEQAFRSRDDAESYKVSIEEMFPEWNFEVIQDRNWWRVRVAVGIISESSLEQASRRVAELESLFWGRRFQIHPVPNRNAPAFYSVTEILDNDDIEPIG